MTPMINNSQGFWAMPQLSTKSMPPAENEKPSWMPRALTMASEVPVRRAWMMYSGHATNMNENSIGSVMPVRNAVSAAEIMMPPTIFFWDGFAVCQMASAAAGRANMKIGKKPVM